MMGLAEFITSNTNATGTLTRESLQAGFDALIAMDEKMAREKAERSREIADRIKREGEPGPLQRQMDNFYYRCGPLITHPRRAEQINAALEAERKERTT